MFFIEKLVFRVILKLQTESACKGNIKDISMSHNNLLTPVVWYALCLIWFIVTHINTIEITKCLEKSDSTR